MKRLLLLAFIPSIIYCSNGTTIFDFLNIPCGARPTAVGGGFSAFGDPHSIFYNPAGICNITTTTFSSTLRHYIAGINSGIILWEKPDFNGVIGIAINYVNLGSIEGRDVDDNLNGSFTPVSLSTKFAYARHIGSFKGGLSVNLIYENIDKYSAFAPAVDIGIIYTPPTVPHIDLGLSLNNLGYVIIPFRDTRENLPYKIKAGLAYQPLPPYIFSLDIERQINGGQDFILGAEIPLSPNFFFRAGYSSRWQDLAVDVSTDVTAGLSFGIGVVRNRLKIDYTASPMVDLGIAHQISISFLQAEEKPEGEKADSLSLYMEKKEKAEEKITQEETRLDSLKNEIEILDKITAEIKKKITQPKKKEEKKYDIYVVKPGDWLSKLAEYPEVYGKGNYKRWIDIYNANKDKIKEPGIIYPGWQIKIPRP